MLREHPEYGFIAQDVLAVFPSLAKQNNDTVILSVYYMKITSLLAGAVQELNQEVQFLIENVVFKSSKSAKKLSTSSFMLSKNIRLRTQNEKVMTT